MAIMGVVHISQYVNDDRSVAASSFDHFASSGSVVSFAGTSQAADTAHQGGGKGNGKTKQPAIKPPAKPLALTDAPWKQAEGHKEACGRYNDKKCPGGAKKGKCPISDRWHCCSTCGGTHPVLDCTQTKPGVPALTKAQKKRKRK